jgi:hypothetical protein
MRLVGKASLFVHRAGWLVACPAEQVHGMQSRTYFCYCCLSVLLFFEYV